MAEAGTRRGSPVRRRSPAAALPSPGHRRYAAKFLIGDMSRGAGQCRVAVCSVPAASVWRGEMIRDIGELAN